MIFEYPESPDIGVLVGPVIAIQEIAVETNRLGRMRFLNTVSDPAHFLLYDWPEAEPGPKTPGRPQGAYRQPRRQNVGWRLQGATGALSLNVALQEFFLVDDIYLVGDAALVLH